MSQRVFVAMSGGVDSAAAALLLRQAGYNVTGVTLRLHPYKDRPGLCGSADDIETARAVAAGMGIPHVVLDLCDLFRERVMDRFVWAYTHGRTPNPCIDCNREIKFGALLDWALDQGADAMATGHYARVRLDTPSGRWQLLRGADRRKDQTYFLYQLTQHQISIVEHHRLPRGDGPLRLCEHHADAAAGQRFHCGGSFPLAVPGLGGDGQGAVRLRYGEPVHPLRRQLPGVEAVVLP